MASVGSERVELRIGVDGLDPGVRASAAFVVAIVDDVAALEPCDPVADLAGAERHARALAVLRRADEVVVVSAEAGAAVARVVRRSPWDMTIAARSDGAAPTRRPWRPWHERRIAFVAPLPPEPSGVATYSARLASALGRRCEVVSVVAGPPRAEPDPARRPAGTSIVGIDAFVADAERGRFDEIVYAIGNHPMHGTQLALLRRFPGAVELHDVRLVGAYAGLYPPGPALDGELARLYPGRHRLGTLAARELSMAPAIEAGVWMVREVASLATTVLTHSRYACALVAADADVPAQSIGPLAVPAPASLPRPSTSPASTSPASTSPASTSAASASTSASMSAATTTAFDDAAPVVLSAGVVDASKRCELLVEAFALLTPRRPDASLIFVGPVDDGYRGRLLALADRAGLGADRLAFSGRLDDAGYEALLARAAVAVQLRSTTNGESSAAVADCLGHGLATIVTAEGAQAELPPDAAVHLEPASTAEQLAATIAELLGDATRRVQLRDAALGYAAANTFDHAAERLLTALFGPDRG